MAGWLVGLDGWLAWVASFGAAFFCGRLQVSGCRSHLFSHVLGCVVFWCEVFAHGSLAGQEAGLIFFHMLLVLWWFGVRCLHLLVDLCEVSAEVCG